ncbi:hypothetical protein K2173_000123 [Erythroxylum novogranatense]|uniref:Acid phosphatase 1 n=1 Tax=Erythroxylum novogranatense TaxID=1862640 RepID=A0AAV8SPN0_9ROSI|nr:hypothetical protein K2173_000123 [Erythroxylum novogranatense]
MAVVHRVMEFVLLALALVSKVTGLNPTFWWPTFPDGGAYCLSWRLAVEANNLRAWRTVPPQCLFYVEKYMTEGQYEKDLNLVIDQIRTYVNQIVPSDDSLDAWILDIDDTCISNVGYYKEKKYGCDPYDPVGFRTWALKGACPAIRSVLGLFRDLIGRGFKVILITGRDEQTLGRATLDNLQTQGFVGYEQLIMRTEAKKLVAEGYRIWGNVGDQWSDLQGEVSGNRTFKLPNPMYYVP